MVALEAKGTKVDGEARADLIAELAYLNRKLVTMGWNACV
jgi:hypothetical protein